ncbi:AP-1-like transcription factor [Microdochium nivale]|nr:AP-1-like transcription factor [Microdochium nivale]
MATARPISAATGKPRPLQLAVSPASAASSPASAASPSSATSATPFAQMPLAIKPVGGPQAVAAAAMAVSAMTPKTSITSKEWVIPPRPKPGRKPATDTPPTKRKAQNRAAQRAFRERRAARVGELEEQLADTVQDHEKTQQDLHDHIGTLESEVQRLRGQCTNLEGQLEKERAERSRAEQELDSLKRRWQMSESSRGSSRHDSFTTLTGGRTRSILSQHAPSRDSFTSHSSEHRNSAFSISQIISPPDMHTSPLDTHDFADVTGCGNCSPTGPCSCVNEALAATSAGCGKCSIGTKCACLEAALNGPIPGADGDLKRRASSPSSVAPEEKRHKSDANSYPNEIDFTAIYSKKKPAPAPDTALTPAPLPLYESNPSMVPRDRCGFCEDGTYCMCAEAAAAAAAAATASQTLPPMGQQVQTPPPSENDVGPPVYEITSTGAVKLPGIRSLNREQFPRPAPKTTGGCGPSGPGTCAQCIADPKSGLFCRSLAAKFAAENGGASGGCCGGSAGGGGCCKTKNAPAPAPTSGSALGVSLSCADAYKTLASHQNFDKVADDIGTWLPKLKAVPREVGASAARPPIEVETASIMSVLRGFDVRFGREP